MVPHVLKEMLAVHAPAQPPTTQLNLAVKKIEAEVSGDRIGRA
jgi:hypothetical protein